MEPLVNKPETLFMAKKRGFANVPKNELDAVKAEVDRLAAEIQAGRNARGFTQEQLAERLGVSLTTIAYLETGRRMPSLPTLIRLAKILKKHVSLMDK